MNKRLFLLGVLIVLAAGCARVVVSKVTPENRRQAGIRFYRPHPYLWVAKADDGSLKGTILWLPDKNEEYVIRVKSGLGSTDMNLKLENGWNLTEFGEVRDAKVPETIEALTGSLEAAAGLLKGGRPGEKAEFMPGLYAFVFDPATGLVSGLAPVFQFK